MSRVTFHIYIKTNNLQPHKDPSMASDMFIKLDYLSWIKVVTCISRAILSIQKSKIIIKPPFNSKYTCSSF